MRKLNFSSNQTIVWNRAKYIRKLTHCILFYASISSQYFSKKEEICSSPRTTTTHDNSLSRFLLGFFKFTNNLTVKFELQYYRVSVQFSASNYSKNQLQWWTLYIYKTLKKPTKFPKPSPKNAQINNKRKTKCSLQYFIRYFVKKINASLSLRVKERETAIVWPRCRRFQ